MFRDTLDAWWVGIIACLPALRLVEPLVLGAALVLIVLLFVGLRRGSGTTRFAG